MATQRKVVRAKFRSERRKLTRDRNARRGGREGKRMIAGYFDQDAFREIKVLGAQQDVSVDVLIHEAFAALFTKLRRPVPKPIVRKLKEHRLDD